MSGSRTRGLAPLALLLAVVVTTFGCADSESRQPVTGQVTLDGQPLPSGIINFRPGPGLTANTSGTAIEDGRYRLPAQHGLLPGNYNVQIQSYRETGRMIQDPQVGPIPERAAAQFEQQGPLQATIVPGPNQIDFHLTSAQATAQP